MAPDQDIVVLTTRERDWWWSMQEVVPALENVWARMAEAPGMRVSFLRVPLAQQVVDSLRRSNPGTVVVTSITAETERVALMLRDRPGASTRFIIYLCGDSTEGFDSFGRLADLLTAHDTLIVSSAADADATRRCYPGAHVVVAPFPLVDQFPLSRDVPDPGRAGASLAYVGRVSEQKNLHTLLLAMWLARSDPLPGSGLTLDIYGAEDNLGSPNMGLTYPGYESYLRQLVDQLGLTPAVTWHGFRPRAWLFDNVHLRPHVLVSASLHSDENFGTSVLASLAYGHQVVATAWGGHLDFQRRFPRQLSTVPVHRTWRGPAVDPGRLADALLRAVDRDAGVTQTEVDEARSAYSEAQSAQRLRGLLFPPGPSRSRLEPSAALLRIRQNRATFGGTRKIYDGYHDPLAHEFFEAYGMGEPLGFDADSGYFLPPWVTVSAGAVSIDDPHRGRCTLEPAREEPAVDVVVCPSMATERLSLQTLRELVAMGYAFVLPRAEHGKAPGSQTRGQVPTRARGGS